MVSKNESEVASGDEEEEEGDYLLLSSEEIEAYFGDPCHEFEHSVIFFVILVIFLGTTIVYCVLLYQRLQYLCLLNRF